MRLSKRFKFCAAHFLPNYEGSCRNRHGHSWECRIEFSGQYNEETGMICDFKILKGIINKRVVDVIDHSDLNDIFENPTAENIVVWIFEQLVDELDALGLAIAKIELWESDDSSVIFDPVEEMWRMEMENNFEG